jgi:excisionase family DNA binding protein
MENSAYTLREAADKLRMSEKSVRRQIDRGHLRKCKVFGRVLIPKKDVDGFFERHAAYVFVA